MNILLTGGAGFIGSNLAEKLLLEGNQVTVIDNFDSFYSKEIKLSNIKSALENANYTFVEGDITNSGDFSRVKPQKIDAIVHLAAKAGVRPSIQNPNAYMHTNIVGTQNLLEFAKDHHIKQFVFASSSSVYGMNKNIPWHESDLSIEPISPYAVTKITGELMGKVYSSLYGIRFIALRLFAVYGPRQRPDLAIHKFVRMIHRGEPIPFFGDGSTMRDYTYIDDIVAGIIGAIRYEKTNYEIVNLGNNAPISLSGLLEIIENVVGKEAKLNKLSEQPGDVPITFADIEKATELFGYRPSTALDEGVTKFYQWMLEHIEKQ